MRSVLVSALTCPNCGAQVRLRAANPDEQSVFEQATQLLWPVEKVIERLRGSLMFNGKRLDDAHVVSTAVETPCCRTLVEPMTRWDLPGPCHLLGRMIERDDRWLELAP